MDALGNFSYNSQCPDGGMSINVQRRPSVHRWVNGYTERGYAYNGIRFGKKKHGAVVCCNNTGESGKDCPGKEASHKTPQIIRFHLYDTSSKSKATEEN